MTSLGLRLFIANASSFFKVVLQRVQQDGGSSINQVPISRSLHSVAREKLVTESLLESASAKSSCWSQ